MPKAHPKIYTKPLNSGYGYKHGDLSNDFFLFCLTKIRVTKAQEIVSYMFASYNTNPGTQLSVLEFFNR